MKFRHVFFTLLFSIILFLPGCEVIAGIFKAGFWTAILLVVLVAGAAIYGYNKLSGKG